MSANPLIDTVIVPGLRDLGAFKVRRALPAAARQRVGPFIFFDQFGPTLLQQGQAVDVRPHPHIGLSTLTWLFEGEIQHKDSLGSDITIRPGEVNWMTAGSGIVHSERSPLSQRQGVAPLGGTQVWLALPLAKEEIAPAFYHYEASEIPLIEDKGITLALVAGSAFGKRSPVHTESESFYADLRLAAGQHFVFPSHIEERALYLIAGSVAIDDATVDVGTMVLLRPGGDIPFHALSDSHLILLGGDALEGPRHLYWNFVSSSPERIEIAKQQWREGSFPTVPGDEIEFIPLPD